MLYQRAPPCAVGLPVESTHHPQQRDQSGGTIKHDAMKHIVGREAHYIQPVTFVRKQGH